MVKLVETADREHFAEQRRKLGIGGSDVAPIMLDKSLRPSWMDSRVEVWLTKTGRREAKADNAAMRRGRAMEEPTAQRYAKRFGYEVSTCPTLVEDDCFVANIDRLVRRPQDAEPIADGIVRAKLVLECKTASKAWGEDMPMYYYAQPQWYMGFIPECEGADVACWFGDMVTNLKEDEPDTDFAVYHFDRDQEFIDNAREVCREFWFKNVKGDVMPEPECEEECRIKWAVSNPKLDAITATVEIEEAIRKIHEIDDLKAELDVERDDQMTKVMKHMGNYGTLKTLKGKVLCTWRVGKSERRTVDWKGMVAKYMKPKDEWIREFTTLSPPQRPFKFVK